MKVDLYTANEQNAPTAGFYLFTYDYAIMMIGSKIRHNGELYQVIYMEWADESRQLLNAFVYKYPGHPVLVSETDNIITNLKRNKYYEKNSISLPGFRL
jgi:hypothetical protein